jgi:hypothetical protein
MQLMVTGYVVFQARIVNDVINEEKLPSSG